MSKRNALRALKRQKMAAVGGYNAHLLDLWFAHEFAEGFQFPGGGSHWYRQHIKRHTVKP